MKLTKKIVVKQRNEIRKMLLDNEKRVVAKLKKKYPQLIKAMKNKWGTTNTELIDRDYYIGVEHHITSRF